MLKRLLRRHAEHEAAELRQRLGREPSRQEVADALGLDVRQLDAALAFEVSEDALLGAADVPATSIENYAECVGALSRLSLEDREHMVARAEGLTLDELGTVLGLSRQRVHQREVVILGRLRAG